MSDDLDALLAGLSGLDVHVTGQDGAVRADIGREVRTGVPEVILADRKRLPDALAATRALLDGRGRAILSRVPDELAERLRSEHADCRIEWHEAARMLVLRRARFEAPNGGGIVGVLTAGTSDIPIAQEAAVVATEMGCRVLSAYDVGVAGIHRLVAPLREFRSVGVDVIVVAAGMDGALPSVVSGLVDVPVIGLPTPIGYGLGGNGIAALLTMLQSCAPGLTVVNIGNGVGAGATAAMIANRVAAARAAARPEAARQ